MSLKRSARRPLPPGAEDESYPQTSPANIGPSASTSTPRPDGELSVF